MERTAFTAYRDKVVTNCARVIVGKDDIIEKVLVSFLCGGHVLLEDKPGTGKTMLLRAFARTVGGDFRRVQFTPDLLPSDLTGINFYNQKTGEFEFRPGPLFTNFVLADEINRATPRTQSALLEAMEEKQITVDDMIAAGIVDPTKVTRSALENAASVAEMVLTTESLVADLPEPPAAPAAAGGDMGGMGGMY